MCPELVNDMELRIMPNLETFQLSPSNNIFVEAKELRGWTLLVQQFAVVGNSTERSRHNFRLKFQCTLDSMVEVVSIDSDVPGSSPVYRILTFSN